MHAFLVCDVNELNLYISVDLDLCYHCPVRLLTVQTKQAAYHFRIISKTTLTLWLTPKMGAVKMILRWARHSPGLIMDEV